MGGQGVFSTRVLLASNAVAQLWDLVTYKAHILPWSCGPSSLKQLCINEVKFLGSVGNIMAALAILLSPV